MKKLLLAVVCSTSLLSIARAEDRGTGTGDAMHSQDAMAPDGAQAPRTEAKQTKKQEKKQEKKPAADPKAKHDGMDRAMEHGAGMDRGSTQQGGQMSGGMK